LYKAVIRSKLNFQTLGEWGERRGYIISLLQDVLRRVFSKLQLNEVVRTSVLSSNWRHMWTVSSKLSLDCVAICGGCRYFCSKQKYTQKFIDHVNTVLRQLHGKVFEDLEIKVEFNSLLVDHLVGASMLEVDNTAAGDKP